MALPFLVLRVGLSEQAMGWLPLGFGIGTIVLLKFHIHVRYVLWIYDLCVSIDRFCFASGAPDNIKIWKFPDGNFLQNFSGHQAIVNTVAINSDNVLVSGGKILTIVFFLFFFSFT